MLDDFSFTHSNGQNVSIVVSGFEDKNIFVISNLGKVGHVIDLYFPPSAVPVQRSTDFETRNIFGPDTGVYDLFLSRLASSLCLCGFNQKPVRFLLGLDWPEGQDVEFLSEIVDAVENGLKGVFLPKSRFPVAVKPTERSRIDGELASEADFNGLYGWQRELDRDEFVLLDGPPYANGSLHVGHAVNKILKDFIVKSQVFGGKKVLFNPGWDCHGLPIENVVRKTLKEKKPEKIRVLAHAHVKNIVNEHRSTFKRWAVTSDWDNPYLTYQPSYVANQLKVFAKIYDKGYVYRDFKPVYWSPSSFSALAESELEYNDKHVSKAVYFAFPVINFKLGDVGVTNWKRREPPLVSALIWTTTPWTLPLNDAVSYNNKLQYSLIQFKDNEKEPVEHYYIICNDLLPALTEVLNREYTVISTFDGSHLDNLYYRSIMYNEIAQPFHHGEHVSASMGTGLVHTCYAHGFDDYTVAIKKGFKVRCYVDDRGCYTRDVGTALEGKFVLKGGQDTVLEMFKKYIVHEQDFEHSYPYDWRTHKPIIIRSTRQWFLNVSNIGEQCVERIERENVNFGTGGHDFKSAMASFLLGRPDWCISRQRVWGVPIPALLDRDQHHTSADFINTVADNVKGDYNWYWNASEQDLIQISGNRELDKDTVVKSTDIMDVWFDSGLSWHTLNGRKADVVLEGKDQFRGWFSSLLLTSMLAEDNIPYKRVLVHGFTVDKNNNKMSKSKGNVISPGVITDGNLKSGAIGADGLRLWVALYGSENPGDVKIGQVVLEEVKARLKQIRLLLRFILGSLEQYDCHAPEKLHYLDQYILKEAMSLETRVRQMYSNYEFRHAANDILQFVRNPYSTVYVNLLKDRLYCDKVGGASHQSAQYTLDKTGRILVALLSPLLPHLTAEYASYHPELSKDLAQSYRDLLTTRQTPVVDWSEDLDQVMELTQSLRKSITETSPAKTNYTLRLTESDRNLLRCVQSKQFSTDSELVELLGVGSVKIQEGDRSEISKDLEQLQVCSRCRKRNSESGELCQRCQSAMSYQ
ncbi:unnamed protein product [Bursaphelenchus okinawaensis]|uniref:isoleucine--tRNA ligase n=1 Tax=Bursaphelenchus okinawaensis TaxID=465554 RepID=A0A811JTG6_9BILA|nr:unnamed protein product [Bursaphelenchus okinawaensis]CAG9081826.1 unnamed protein product [Bursaphelenchus okinawaensis]